MTKFGSSEDSGYESLLGELRQWMQEVWPRDADVSTYLDDPEIRGYKYVKPEEPLMRFGVDLSPPLRVNEDTSFMSDDQVVTISKLSKATLYREA